MRHPVRRIAISAMVLAAALSITVVVMRSRCTGHVCIEDIVDAYRAKTGTEYRGITITYPVDGTLFPPEIVPPTIQWTDDQSQCDTWLVRVEFGGDEEPIHALSHAPQWTPAPAEWETIKQQSRDHGARVVILGVRDVHPVEICSGGHVTICTSNTQTTCIRTNNHN